jgi:hypothetical protein
MDIIISILENITGLLLLILIFIVEVLLSLLVLPRVMGFDYELIKRLLSDNQVFFVSFLVIIVSITSLTIGHTVAMRIARVSRVRYLFNIWLSILINLIIYAIWALVIWASLLLFQPTEVSFFQALEITGITFAPMMLSFIILFPHAGGFLVNILHLWSMLLLLYITQAIYGLQFWQALTCVGAGYIVDRLADATIGRPLIQLNLWLQGKRQVRPEELQLKRFAEKIEAMQQQGWQLEKEQS